MAQTSFDARTGFDMIVSARDCPQAPASCLKGILGLSSVGFLLLLTGCGSTTLFQSSFNNAVGTPPSHNQSTGTIDVSGAPGSVVIVSPPPNATGNWAQIQRIGDPRTAPITTMQCSLSQSPGDGSYSLLAVLFIPSGSGLATVEFDTSGQAAPGFAEFLHLDFMQNNTVRINDTGPVFGAFPRDQFFTLAVTLDITAASATAHMNLYGTGASGSLDFNVTPLFLARQFGAVKFWMGFPWIGSFDVNSILVTRKN